MRCYARLSCISVLGLLCACSGGGSTGTTTTIPQSNPVGTNPTSDARSVQLGLQPTTATLPVVSQITGTLLFPAVATPTTLELSASATAPAGVALDSVRRTQQQQSGTLTVYEYFTLVPATSVTLPNIPAVTLNFPDSTPLAGKSFYYGISDLNAQGGLVSFDTQGPGTINGQTVSFAQVPTAITFVAGHRYTFVVYATAAKIGAGAGEIYVANFGNIRPFEPSVVTTYNADGSRTTPTISAGLDFPVGIAVDAAGKLYVANAAGDTVTTYNADGAQTTPTITAELSNPLGVAVDATGKIHVANGNNNTVTTYNADGSTSTPTITIGLNSPNGVAVDAVGKIYVANQSNNTVTTYNADGTKTTPTITAGLDIPAGVAVDAAGKIYVTNVAYKNNSVTTYNADGSRTTPTITAGLNSPSAIAVDAAGKIYVTNANDNTVTTYDADGTRTTPTITTGYFPDGIAVK